MSKTVKILSAIVCSFIFCFMAIGYAEVSDKLTITGNANLSPQTGVYIVDASYGGGDGAININAYVSTTMNSTVTLKENGDSTLLLNIKVYNSNQEIYAFNTIKYMQETIDNENIGFSLPVLKQGDEVAVGGFLEFEVLFSYKNQQEILSNVLNSVLNYEFLPLSAFAPDEVLPDDEQATQVGENHMALIEKILNEDQKGYGLNETRKPIIHNYLNKVGDVVYCEQNVQGGNLKHVMIDELVSANQLLFQIEYVSDTEYVTYTYRAEDIDNATVGDVIPVFRTIMTKENGVWDASKSYEGGAAVCNPSEVGLAIDSSTYTSILNN